MPPARDDAKVIDWAPDGACSMPSRKVPFLPSSARLVSLYANSLEASNASTAPGRTRSRDAARERRVDERRDPMLFSLQYNLACPEADSTVALCPEQMRNQDQKRAQSNNISGKTFLAVCWGIASFDDLPHGLFALGFSLVKDHGRDAQATLPSRCTHMLPIFTGMVRLEAAAALSGGAGRDSGG